MGKFFGFLKSKLGFIFTIGVYVHRTVDACKDIKIELCNALCGFITWSEFFKQIVPTFKYHISGKFQEQVTEIMKNQHIGLDNDPELDIKG